LGSEAFFSGSGAFFSGSGAFFSGSGAFFSCSGADCSGSGSGATTVVVGEEWLSGLANAGATPPVNAVREMTTPDASTATTPRLEQNSIGAPIVHLLLWSQGASQFATAAMRSHPPTSAWYQQLAATLFFESGADAWGDPDAPVSVSSSLVPLRCYTVWVRRY
jgi:hypothetical protein